MTELRQRIEDKLLAVVETDDPRLTEMTSHLVRAGGKRLRPVLCSLASIAEQDQDLAAISGSAIDGGIAVELVHVGSLHHDDVIDEALTRHDVDSVNVRWGNLRAILSGDYLLARALSLCASLGQEVAGLLASTIGAMCVGATRELHFTYSIDRTKSDYFAAIEGKTAVLFETACRIGSHVGDVSDEGAKALAQFGLSYGMAFQVIDDVLDVVSTDEKLGKPAGHDMVEGVYNLPVLEALTGPDAANLAALLGGPLDDKARLDALELVRASDGVDKSLRVAQDYADRAVAALEPLPDGPAIDALATAARHLVAT